MVAVFGSTGNESLAARHRGLARESLRQVPLISVEPAELYGLDHHKKTVKE